jgi:hypothetical protein
MVLLKTTILSRNYKDALLPNRPRDCEGLAQYGIQKFRSCLGNYETTTAILFRYY